MRPVAALSLAVALLVCPGSSRAAELPCTPIGSGSLQLDGLLTDWNQVTPLRVHGAAAIVKGRGSWSGPRDLGFDLYCNHDSTHLYLALRVVDEYFVRTRAARGDDHVTIRFGNRALVIHPGDLRSIGAQVRWGTKRPPKGVLMAEAMQEDGYSIEVKLPLRLIPGYRPGAPSLSASVEVADSDSKAKRRIETVASSGRLRIAFAQQRADLAAFLRDKGYRRSQIRFKKTANVAGDRRLEQVLFVGRTLGVVGEGMEGGGYFYLDLPVRSPRDVTSIKLLDLNGDRRAEIVVRYLERAASGSRELLAVFRFDQAEKFVRPLMQEVRKQQGTRVLTNQVSFKQRKRRRRKPGGVDIVIEKPAARGFDQASYREAPARDAFPILLPWQDPPRRVFRFEGDEFSEL